MPPANKNNDEIPTKGSPKETSVNTISIADTTIATNKTMFAPTTSTSITASKQNTSNKDTTEPTTRDTNIKTPPMVDTKEPTFTEIISLLEEDNDSATLLGEEDKQEVSINEKDKQVQDQASDQKDTKTGRRKNPTKPTRRSPRSKSPTGATRRSTRPKSPTRKYTPDEASTTSLPKNTSKHKPTTDTKKKKTRNSTSKKKGKKKEEEADLSDRPPSPAPQLKTSESKKDAPPSNEDSTTVQRYEPPKPPSRRYQVATPSINDFPIGTEVEVIEDHKISFTNFGNLGHPEMFLDTTDEWTLSNAPVTNAVMNWPGDTAQLVLQNPHNMVLTASTGEDNRFALLHTFFGITRTEDNVNSLTAMEGYDQMATIHEVDLDMKMFKGMQLQVPTLDYYANAAFQGMDTPIQKDQMELTTVVPSTILPMRFNPRIIDLIKKGLTKFADLRELTLQMANERIIRALERDGRKHPTYRHDTKDHILDLTEPHKSINLYREAELRPYKPILDLCFAIQERGMIFEKGFRPSGNRDIIYHVAIAMKNIRDRTATYKNMLQDPETKQDVRINFDKTSPNPHILEREITPNECEFITVAPLAKDPENRAITDYFKKKQSGESPKITPEQTTMIQRGSDFNLSMSDLSDSAIPDIDKPGGTLTTQPESEDMDEDSTTITSRLNEMDISDEDTVSHLKDPPEMIHETIQTKPDPPGALADKLEPKVNILIARKKPKPKPNPKPTPKPRPKPTSTAEYKQRNSHTKPQDKTTQEEEGELTQTKQNTKTTKTTNTQPPEPIKTRPTFPTFDPPMDLPPWVPTRPTNPPPSKISPKNQDVAHQRKCESIQEESERSDGESNPTAEPSNPPKAKHPKPRKKAQTKNQMAANTKRKPRQRTPTKKKHSLKRKKEEAKTQQDTLISDTNLENTEWNPVGGNSSTDGCDGSQNETSSDKNDGDDEESLSDWSAGAKRKKVTFNFNLHPLKEKRNKDEATSSDDSIEAEEVYTDFGNGVHGYQSAKDHIVGDQFENAEHYRNHPAGASLYGPYQPIVRRPDEEVSAQHDRYQTLLQTLMTMISKQNKLQEKQLQQNEDHFQRKERKKISAATEQIHLNAFTRDGETPAKKLTEHDINIMTANSAVEAKDIEERQLRAADCQASIMMGSAKSGHTGKFYEPVSLVGGFSPFGIALSLFGTKYANFDPAHAQHEWEAGRQLSRLDYDALHKASIIIPYSLHYTFEHLKTFTTQLKLRGGPKTLIFKNMAGWTDWVAKNRQILTEQMQMGNRQLPVEILFQAHTIAMNWWNASMIGVPPARLLKDDNQKIQFERGNQYIRLPQKLLLMMQEGKKRENPSEANQQGNKRQRKNTQSPKVSHTNQPSGLWTSRQDYNAAIAPNLPNNPNVPKFNGTDECARWAFLGACHQDCPRAANHIPVPSKSQREQALLEFKKTSLSRNKPSNGSNNNAQVFR